MPELLAAPERVRIDMAAVGHCEEICPNPVRGLIAIINQRLEVGLLNLESNSMQLLTLTLTFTLIGGGPVESGVELDAAA